MQEKINYIKCKRCGIAELSETLIDGVCEDCRVERRQEATDVVRVNGKSENPYLMLGFFEFAILSTLMVVFFPWSLLFCVIFFGIEATKLIVIALLHDFLKTVFAVISVLVPVIIGILLIIFS